MAERTSRSIDVTWILGTESELEAERKGKKTTFWIDSLTFYVREISQNNIVISEKAIKEAKEIRVPN